MKKKYQWETMIDFQSTDLNQGDTGVQGLTLFALQKEGCGLKTQGCMFSLCVNDIRHFPQVLWLPVAVHACDANWELCTGP